MFLEFSTFVIESSAPVPTEFMVKITKHSLYNTSNFPFPEWLVNVNKNVFGRTHVDISMNSSYSTQPRDVFNMNAAGLYLYTEHVQSKYQWVSSSWNGQKTYQTWTSCPSDSWSIHLFTSFPSSIHSWLLWALVVMVTVSMLSLSPDCDLCLQDQKGL